MTMAFEGENDGGAAAAAGSAADLLGGAAAAGASDGGAGEGGAAGAGDPAGGGSGGAAGDITGGADPEWYSSLSAEADGDNPSHRDYAKAKGWKTPDDVTKSYREMERLQRESGRVKVPAEGAKPEEIAEFRKAIGVPEDAKGYTIPEIKGADGNPIPLNDSLLNGVLEDAHAEGLPKAGVDGLVAKFIQRQLDEVADIDNKMKADAEKHVASWGSEKVEKMAAIDRAAAALGITKDEMVALRNAWGPEKALDRLVKLGQGMAEDVLITGGKGRFGVSGAEAKAEMDKLKADPEFQKKVSIKGSPERMRWDRLQAAVGEYEAKQQQAA
jgi:hypothetical protein